MARLSLLAYESEGKIKELAKLWRYADDTGKSMGGNLFQFYFHRDSQGFVMGNKQDILAVFRGTMTGKNIVDDLNISKIPFVGGQAHKGFLDALQNIWSNMQAYYQGVS